MEERKINIDRKPLTSEEIASRRNFDSVLSGSKVFSKPPFYKTGWFTIGIAVIAVTVTTTVASLIIDGDEQNDQLAENSQTDSAPLIEDDFDYTDDTPCIQPPLKELDVEYSSYFVNAEDGGTLVHHTGSEITIPPHAFEDDDGNRLAGPIEIRYREFHDQLDIFLSGIPMEYDSAGTTYNFESAGMLEILGYQNDHPVNIRPEESIEINLSSSNPSPTFNVYYLDQDNKEWVNKGKDNIISAQPEDQLVQLSSEEIQMQPEVVECNKLVSQLTKDKETIAAEVQEAVKQTDLTRAEKPTEPKRVNENNYSFDLSVDPSEFPELSSYKGVVFEVSPEEKSFNSQVFQVEWSDAQISKNDEGNHYEITLTKGNRKETYKVMPALKGQDFKNAYRAFEEKFDQYQKQLTTRLETEAKKKAEYQEKIRALEEAQERQKRLFDQYRVNMELISGNAKSEQKISVRTKVSRVFSIMSFGVYNSDRTIPAKPNGQKFMASFVSINQEPLLLETAQLIEKNTNSVYNYSSTEFEKFKMDPKEDNLLLAITPSGKLGFFDSEYMHSISPKAKEHTFHVNLFDVSKMSRQELRDKLGY